MTEWRASGWWRVLHLDGSIWAETSSEAEARRVAEPGMILQRHERLTEERWVFTK